MSDEKRQTRLLPFRLRRAGAQRRDARGGFDRNVRGEFDGNVRGGFDGAEDFSADAELTALLRTWDAPRHTAQARERLLADFRANVLRAPLWRRALSAELRVPLPIAACAVFAFLLSIFALGTRAWTRTAPPESKTLEPSVVKVVEVPVVHERVVTHTVYVEKKERGAGRGVSSRAEARDAVTVDATDVAVQKQSAHPAATGTPAGYFTRVDMGDFQPADDMKIRILKKGRADEK
jgi:hypothetical protein